ncbi:conjugal transfer nickase/helicase domain-containing protein, partial [Pseudomonas sp. GTC 16482]|uniref:conjugal transfer nickase/helicase domain-containing protein n=1 Tax=Pseudomonas sp. GTC 16482 TaxID=1661693 RepID=UPI000B191F8D
PNIALFDELQSHGLVDVTPEGKAVWSATVSEDDWQHRFTFLRLQPSLIWANEPRPDYFSGTVEPMMDGPLPTSETNESAPDQPPATPEAKQAGAVLQNQEFDYLDDLMDMLQVQGERESGSAVEMAQSATPPPQYSVGQAFIEWLREGVNSHRLVINDSKAKVHTVDGTFFLVTPGIFQRYAAEQPEQSDGSNQIEHWRRVQRQFEKLGIHRKRSNGQNIWACTVRGPRKTNILNGYLLNSSTDIFAALPADNSHLVLVK